MNKTKLKYILIIVLLGTLSISLFNLFNKPKTAYVDTVKVYNSFEMKIELEKKLEETKNARARILDSLLNEVETVVSYLRQYEKDKEAENKYEFLRQQYLNKEQQFDEDNRALAQQYTDQVWNQLNQYVKDFGVNQKYEYIYGTIGQGNLMYAKEQLEISDELLKYVNERYQGKTN